MHMTAPKEHSPAYKVPFTSLSSIQKPNTIYNALRNPKANIQRLATYHTLLLQLVSSPQHPLSLITIPNSLEQCASRSSQPSFSLLALWALSKPESAPAMEAFRNPKLLVLLLVQFTELGAASLDAVSTPERRKHSSGTNVLSSGLDSSAAMSALNVKGGIPRSEVEIYCL